MTGSGCRVQGSRGAKELSAGFGENPGPKKNIGKLDSFIQRWYKQCHRDVAQSGSAPEWGSGGRWFKSSRPDQKIEGGWSAQKWGDCPLFLSKGNLWELFSSKIAQNICLSPASLKFAESTERNLSGLNPLERDSDLQAQPPAEGGSA